MTEQDEDAVLIDEVAQWMLINYHRDTWDLLRMLARGWPDLSASQTWRAWTRMNGLAEENRQRTLRQLQADRGLQVIEGGDEGEDPEGLE